MAAKVSIISPAYNHAAFIEDCILSVRKQSFTDWEMIIIDDGSLDDTYAIAQKWAAQDPRIRAYTQENVGILCLAETYNRSLKAARGQYIAILECDDVWEPNKLELQVPFMESHPEIVMCYGRAYQKNKDLSRVLGIMPLGQAQAYFNNDPLLSFAEAAILGHIFPPPVSVLIRRETLEACGGFQQSHGLPLVDTPTFVALSQLGPFYFMDEILGSWRSTPHQITKTYTAQMTESFYRFALEVCERYHFANTVRRAVHSYYQSALVVAYSRSGRYKLMRREFAPARKDYVHAIFSTPIWKEPVWRLRALTGYIMSWMRKDVEGLAKILGKRYY